MAPTPGQGPHPSGQDSQAGRDAFVAGLEQQLQSQADAQQGPTCLTPVPQWLNQISLVQLLHGGIEGTHPRQHQGLARGHACRIGDGDHGGSKAFQGPLHRMQIAHAVVDQADLAHAPRSPQRWSPPC